MPVQPVSGVSLVRQGLVLAGLICAIGAAFVTGISCSATLLLYGPMIAAVNPSLIASVTFAVPNLGSD